MAQGDLHCYNPVVFDLETSGPGDPTQIIQIAAYAPAWRGPGASFEVKIDFDIGKADLECLQKNCYDPAVWDAEAISKDEALEGFSAFLRRHASLKKISGKNKSYRVCAGMGYMASKFDMPLLQEWYGDEFLPMDIRVFDVFFLAQWLLPQLVAYTLSDVAHALGVLREGAHDASVDVLMTADVAAILLHRCGKDYRWVKRRLKRIRRAQQED